MIEGKRVVLITGASSGFGKACADRLSRAGYVVYGTSRRARFGDSDSINPAWCCIPLDITNDDTIKTAVEYILKREQRIDIVINNAGMALAGSVEDCSDTEILQQLDTNFLGPWRVCRAVMPHMRQQKDGYIINVSSIAGLVGIPFQAAYSSAKFALEAMTEVLRMEVKPYGIKVALVEPGDFRTRLTDNRVIAKQCSGSVYRERFDTALNTMIAEEQNGRSPEHLARLVEKIIALPSPRLRYTCGKPVQRLVPFLKRLLPASWVELTLRKMYGI